MALLDKIYDLLIAGGAFFMAFVLVRCFPITVTKQQITTFGCKK